MINGRPITFGGGGNGGLNFNVVGGLEAPASPKENTLWVETEHEITGYIVDSAFPDYSTVRPSEAEEGTVWLVNNDRSSTAFNALKKDELWVYLIECLQFLNGEWESMSFHVYQNGEWIAIEGETMPDTAPTSYTLIETLTSPGTTEWKAPEAGYFQFEVMGSSGSGGVCKVANYSWEGLSSRRFGGGGGGGSGGYSSTRVTMYRGDSVTITLGGIAGDSSVVFNSPVDGVELTPVVVTGGKNGADGTAASSSSAGGTGGSGGVASGGSVKNTSGKAGANGGRTNSGGNDDVSMSVAYGGSAAISGGMVGGNGGYLSYFRNSSDYTITPPTSGQVGWIKIYRGNTNYVV